MKNIKLTQGKYAIVDDNFAWLNKYKWYFSNGYAVRQIQKNYKRTTIWMHRIINGIPHGLYTDHKNRNKLDNRKTNLRTATKSNNNMNMPLRSHNTSGYCGVSWDKSRNKWIVIIRKDKKPKNIGRFNDLNMAIDAYNAATLELYGEFAHLNEIPQSKKEYRGY